ncbi:hypothetical protein GCM10009550_75150 [Actinocorallia libanotica]|uniref:Uncharacterized protein n=1 Tax=Actinocorallia libanotica TaxID=46162 RepID=A0ABP4CGL2_9ACTN
MPKPVTQQAMEGFVACITIGPIWSPSVRRPATRLGAVVLAKEKGFRGERRDRRLLVICVTLV